MRYPAISPDGKTIAFTFKGDIYRIPSAGGTATPLTSHTANDFMPVWSHDGKQIAFASDRYGNYDIYVINADGGEAKRLTFHSADEFPTSFSADDKSILFSSARQDAASNRQFPTAALPELYEVPAAGGRPTQVLTTPAENAKPSRNGQLLIYEDKKGQENQWRKHHVSAVARDIWIYDRKAGTHRQITTFAGEDRNPVFTDDEKAFYYLSEESGSFNVHKMSVEGGKSQQLTSFKGVPVRFLSIANTGTLAFGFDGQIYTMPAGGRPQKLDIAVSADNRANNERILSVNNGAQNLVVAPSGKEVAFTYRGDVFVNSVEGGGTKRITTTPETENGVEFAPDGKSIVYASERGGKWSIYEARRTRDAEPYFFASTVVKEAPVVSNEHQNTHPSYSPDGKQLAYLEDRNNLRILDLATKQTRTILTDKELFGGDHHFEWSPDGKWILFDLDVPGIAPGEIGLVRADGTGKVINLTESGFNDARGKWILGGKAMLWFSNRDGLKSVAQSGQAQQDAYAMFFDREAWERFRLNKDEIALVKEAEDKLAKVRVDSVKQQGDTARPARKGGELALDLDGIDERKARLTVASASMGDALVSKDGEMLYYLARFEKGMNLWSTNMRTKETKMVLTLNANSGNMAWDKEQKYIFLLSDGAISRIDPTSAKRDMVAMSGEEALDVDAERAAMFDHVWRRTRDTFYSKGYHGIDWIGLRPVYAKYLPYIGNNFEFAEMMAEMLGELNISHSGATFNQTNANDDNTASLGLLFDQTYTGAGREDRRGDQGRSARSPRRDDSPGNDHRVGRRQPDPAEQGHRRVPQSQGGQERAARSRRRRDEVGDRRQTRDTSGGEPAALCTLGQAQRRRRRQGQQRPARLRAHSRHERRRVSHDVRGHHGQVCDAEGRRRRHALQRGRRPRRRPRDVPERQEILRLHDGHAQHGLRAELPMDQADGRDGERGELQRRPLFRVHLQGAEARSARRHADARYLHVRRLGVAAGWNPLGRARRRREGCDDRQVFRESANRP